MTASEGLATLGDIARFSKYYWGRARGWIALYLILMVSNVALQNIAMPYYIGRLTNIVAAYANNVANAIPALRHDFILFSLSSLFAVILWSIAMIVWNRITAQTLYDIANETLSKVQRFSADWHNNSFAGGTVRKITRGMASFDTFSRTIFTGFSLIFLVLICTVFTLWTHVPQVGLFLTLFILVYFGLSVVTSITLLLPRYRRAATSDTRLGATLADIMTGIPTVKSFAGEDREDALFRSVTGEWYKNALNSWQTARYVDAVRSLMRTVLLTGMVGITIWQWTKGLATPGDLAVVLTCYFNINHLLRDMGVLINDIQKASAEMEDIVHFWHRDQDIRDIPHATALQVAKGTADIVFDHVRFAYASTLHPVYEDLSVSIRAGEKIALVGMSGSGKSTFVKLLQRLYDLQGGAITIAGQNIAQVTQTSLRAQIALVPQDPILFHRSLAENIAYARPSATRAQIEDAAKRAFAHDFIQSFPQGYDTLVGERGVKLSGGERQRVALARAILADTPILVLDEATSSLDSLSEHYIQRALDTLMQGRTTITIAHRLATIRAVDRILVFDGGRIVEQGSHTELLARTDSLYKRLYDMQALGLVDQIVEGDNDDNDI